jgi:hypothetical protein
MRRIIATTLAFILCICLLSVTVSAAEATGSLTGPSVVRAGDTITVTFSVSGSGVLGLQGSISYDSSILTLTGTSQKVGSPWMVEFNGSKFVAYDNNQTNPINSSTALFALTFKVDAKAATGAAFQVSCENLKVSDGGKEVAIGTVTYSKEITRPLSKDNTLKSLNVSNATISPAFSPDTTSYTAEVPYEVSKLDLVATANQSGAKVSIDNPSLTANGTTKVTITVTAESGSKKTYTISVKRAQDPNYVKSGDNTLSAITVDGFFLSPVFAADTTEYVIWLPFETETVTVSGTANDKNASVRVEGGESLLPGADNAIRVICTAEDGTERVYTVVAKRAADPNAPTEPPTEPPPEPPTEPPTEPTETTPPTQPAENTDVITLRKGGALLIAVLLLIAGVSMGIILGRVSRR